MKLTVISRGFNIKLDSFLSSRFGARKTFMTRTPICQTSATIVRSIAADMKRGARGEAVVLRVKFKEDECIILASIPMINGTKREKNKTENRVRPKEIIRTAYKYLKTRNTTQ